MEIADLEGKPGPVLEQAAVLLVDGFVENDPVSRTTLIAGSSELHLEIILDRLRREFNVTANVGRPRVAYRETLTQQVLGRRAGIASQGVRHGMMVIDARVPLAEMFGYAVDLRERPHGCGTFSMQFDRYVPCPPPAEDEGARDSFVAAPRRPRPPSGRSNVALPEPGDPAMD